VATELDEALDAVGPRLRALRRQRETTLADLSAATGISVSTLSRLESGARRPTLELLLPLARAYGLTLDDLVGAPPTGDPRIHLRPVTRHGMVMLPLTRRAGGIQAYKLVIPARNRRSRPDPQTHEGYEWLYVLNGRLRLILGDQDLVLEPGEAAEFDTRVPHWFGAAGTEGGAEGGTERGAEGAAAGGTERSTEGGLQAVEFLSLFGRQGERAHLRARPKVAPR
jgi:transcriptional regulator with XRE-family HTH domain